MFLHNRHIAFILLLHVHVHTSQYKNDQDRFVCVVMLSLFGVGREPFTGRHNDKVRPSEVFGPCQQ